MKRILAIAIAGLALGACTSAASAMPIRGFAAYHDAEVYVVGARAYSPATADGCGAFYRITIYDFSGNVRKARTGSFNACRYQTTGSYTYGIPAAFFYTGDLPHGTYAVCVAARQTINYGQRYSHGVCRARYI